MAWVAFSSLSRLTQQEPGRLQGGSACAWVSGEFRPMNETENKMNVKKWSRGNSAEAIKYILKAGFTDTAAGNTEFEHLAANKNEKNICPAAAGQTGQRSIPAQQFVAGKRKNI